MSWGGAWRARSRRREGHMPPARGCVIPMHVTVCAPVQRIKSIRSSPTSSSLVVVVVMSLWCSLFDDTTASPHHHHHHHHHADREQITRRKGLKKAGSGGGKGGARRVTEWSLWGWRWARPFLAAHNGSPETKAGRRGGGKADGRLRFFFKESTKENERYIGSNLSFSLVFYHAGGGAGGAGVGGWWWCC